MRSVHKQRVAREATGGHRLRIRRTGGELAGKACSRSSAGRITSLSHLISRRAPSKRKSAEQKAQECGRTSAAEESRLCQPEEAKAASQLAGDFSGCRAEAPPPMHFPARYREPTQPRANALGRGPGGARRNRKARRHDPTGRPAKKCMRPQIEEAEGR